MIFTFNVRDNIIWEIIRNHFNTTPEEFNNEINLQFEEFLDYLKNRKIEYKQLKSALIPNRDKDKYELLFCFDTNINPKISCYGQRILELIFSLLNSKTVHSIHTGDFIIEDMYQRKAHELFFNNIKYVKKSIWIYSSQYYFVYVNNVTKSERKQLLEELLQEEMYIGYCDFTFNNDLKDLLAYVLSSTCIKKGNKILFPCVSLDECFYSFEYKGYIEVPIEQELYFSFLDYKIESSLIYAIDVNDSVNAVAPFYIDITTVDIEIESNKLDYLKMNKANIIKRSGMENFKEEDLCKLLKEKIRQNYIYNLDYDEWGNVRFNILFEILCLDKKIKMLAAFKYNPRDNKINLITLF